MGLGFDRLLSLVMMPLQMWQEEQARKDNQKRYDQLINGGLGAIGVPSDTKPEDIARLAGGDVTALDKQNADLLAASDASAKQQLASFDSDRGRLMGYLDTLGIQERKDIERVATEQNNAADARIRGLGLGGTSISTSARRGMMREKSDQINRLNERLSQQRMGADEALSGQRRALEGGLSDRNIGLRDDVASRRFDFVNRTLGNIANTITNRTDSYPDQGIYLGLQQALGQGAGNRQYLDSVNNNWASSIFGPAAGTAAGTAAGIGTAALVGGALAPATGGASLGVIPNIGLSDRRAKKNIKTVGKLKDGTRIKSFNFKGEKPGAMKHVGVIAQEVERKHPDLVTTGADGLKRVNYGGLRRRVG